tara:strand:- start:564 stop:728 length:165 start_codon:yes stop_codon:yes gene_type:complete
MRRGWLSAERGREGSFAIGAACGQLKTAAEKKSRAQRDREETERQAKEKLALES